MSTGPRPGETCRDRVPDHGGLSRFGGASIGGARLSDSLGEIPIREYHSGSGRRGRNERMVLPRSNRHGTPTYY